MFCLNLTNKSRKKTFPFGLILENSLNFSTRRNEKDVSNFANILFL